MFRVGLRQCLDQLNDEVEVVEAESFDAAVRVLGGRKSIDLVLFDPELGADQRAIATILELAAGSPVVLFSAASDPAHVLAAIDSGAAGYMPRNADSDRIVGAIKTVLAGGVYVRRELLARASVSRAGARPTRGFTAARARYRTGPRLTPRQRQVLACIAEGMGNAEIASQLALSENTVRGHVSAVLRALNVPNRTRAALMAPTILGNVEEQGSD